MIVYTPRLTQSKTWHGVATITSLLKIIGLSAEYLLFYRALLQKRPIILRSLLMVTIPSLDSQTSLDSQKGDTLSLSIHSLFVYMHKSLNHTFTLISYIWVYKTSVRTPRLTASKRLYSLVVDAPIICVCVYTLHLCKYPWFLFTLSYKMSVCTPRLTASKRRYNALSVHQLYICIRV